MSAGTSKLAGGQFFEWIAAGKRVYTDLSWSVGFAPRWLVREVEKRGAGHDRILFASDQPWGDFTGELAKLRGAVGDGELARRVFQDTFDELSPLSKLLAGPGSGRADRHGRGDRGGRGLAADGRIHAGFKFLVTA